VSGLSFDGGGRRVVGPAPLVVLPGAERPAMSTPGSSGRERLIGGVNRRWRLQSEREGPQFVGGGPHQ
jgi:hypothetical protein